MTCTISRLPLRMNVCCDSDLFIYFVKPVTSVSLVLPRHSSCRTVLFSCRLVSHNEIQTRCTSSTLDPGTFEHWTPVEKLYECGGCHKDTAKAHVRVEAPTTICHSDMFLLSPCSFLSRAPLWTSYPVTCCLTRHLGNISDLKVLVPPSASLEERVSRLELKMGPNFVVEFHRDPDLEDVWVLAICRQPQPPLPLGYVGYLTFGLCFYDKNDRVIPYEAIAGLDVFMSFQPSGFVFKEEFTWLEPAFQSPLQTVAGLWMPTHSMNHMTLYAMTCLKEIHVESLEGITPDIYAFMLDILSGFPADEYESISFDKEREEVTIYAPTMLTARVALSWFRLPHGTKWECLPNPRLGFEARQACLKVLPPWVIRKFEEYNVLGDPQAFRASRFIGEWAWFAYYRLGGLYHTRVLPRLQSRRLSQLFAP